MKDISVGFAARFMLASSLAMVACLNINAEDKHSFYRQTNLVADLPGVAQIQDTNLVNAWGVSFSPTSPFWVSDNATKLSTLYAVTNDSTGLPHVAKQTLEVHIPGAGGPTGQVFNNTTNFNGDVFLFVGEDGTIAGWRPALSNAAEVLNTRPGAVYKGVTLATMNGNTLLLAANFSENTVDVYDGTTTLIAQLKDPHAPGDYAPFNVRSIDGIVFVTFAKQDADKVDDVPGPGHGLVDVLDLQHGKFLRLVTGSDAGGRFRAISSPWGIAVSPSTFGEHADQLLIGNFGSGTIMSFSERGHFEGFLEDRSGQPVVIDGLWALTFGNGAKAGVSGTLYFTAGPEDEEHGLFGALDAVSRHKGHGHQDDDDDDRN